MVALGTRGVVHHIDRGSQYLSIRYSERLAEAKAQPSVGGVGDSYDNALAETIIGLTRPRSIKTHVDSAQHHLMLMRDGRRAVRAARAPALRRPSVHQAPGYEGERDGSLAQ